MGKEEAGSVRVVILHLGCADQGVQVSKVWLLLMCVYMGPIYWGVSIRWSINTKQFYFFQ